MLCFHQEITVRACLVALTLFIARPSWGDDPAVADFMETGLIESDVQQVGGGATTLQELESIALTSHPAIAVARARVSAACGQQLQAGLRFNPILQYQGQEIGNEGDAGIHTLSLSQQFATANKLGIARHVQAQVVRKQNAELRFAELKVLTNLRTVFAQTLVAQQRAELTDEMVALAEKSFESVQSLYKAEEVSKVSVLQSRVEADQARIAAEVAATDLAAKRRALAAAAGITELTADRLSGSLEDRLIDQPWEALIEKIESTSPELSVAGSELERARWALQQACAGAIPNVTAQVGLGRDSATDDVFTQFGISIPLPIYNRNQGNLRTAHANIRAAEASIDQTRIDLASRLAAAVGRYQTARRRYERLQESILPSAEETFQLSQQAFEAGESSYLQLMAAQRTLISTRLAILKAIAAARQAMAQIDGMLVTVGQ